MKGGFSLREFMAGFLAVPYGDLSDRWEACDANLYGKPVSNPYEKSDMPMPFIEDIHIDINENLHLMKLM